MVALIYWGEMANAQYEQEWYDNHILDFIQLQSYMAAHNISSHHAALRSLDDLPNSQSWGARTIACMTGSYKQASLNAMVVGNVVGELVKHIRNDIAKEHSYTTFCIGHSLGAHVCGFIGNSSNMVNNG